MDVASELISASDKQLRRLELLIEQHRLHMTAVHPSRRASLQRALKRMLADYARLRENRAGLGRGKVAA